MSLMMRKGKPRKAEAQRMPFLIGDGTRLRSDEFLAMEIRTLEGTTFGYQKSEGPISWTFGYSQAQNLRRPSGHISESRNRRLFVAHSQPRTTHQIT